MKVYSYVVAYDSGFAPNPFHGLCTLACCKPLIRRSAQPGDLIVGLGKRAERVVYTAEVTQVIDFAKYWNAARYKNKRPTKGAPLAIERSGDNIYEPWAIGEFRQRPSRHSHPDGTENVESKRTDLGGLHVVVSDTYVYFGKEGPLLPSGLAFLEIGRGHRCRFTPAQIAQVTAWFDGLPRGVHGPPALWPSGDLSWQQESQPRSRPSSPSARSPRRPVRGCGQNLL